ncbi:MAG: hypothetical protein GY801_19485 [bacterium]|nr:hypothetical protein [bacterium]
MIDAFVNISSETLTKVPKISMMLEKFSSYFCNDASQRGKHVCSIRYKKKSVVPTCLWGGNASYRISGNGLGGIPKRISKSRMIPARRKSGKTAFVQRLFNELWSQGGEVIPFYFSIVENKIWYPDFAELYYCTFASQYFSFVERDPQLMKTPLSLDDIDARGSDFFSRNVHEIRNNRTWGNYAAVWNIASSAPNRWRILGKAQVYAVQMPDKQVLPAFLSLGGFQEPALRLCETHGIATADRIAHF